MPAPAPSTTATGFEDQKLLNAYIYDYLVKQSLHETARALCSEADVPTITEEEAKRRVDSSDGSESTLSGALTSGLQKKGLDSSTNGTERAKSSSPGSASPKLEPADVAINVEGGFLAEWWTIFWDMFAARQGRPSSNNAASFMAHNQRLKSERQTAAAAASMTQGNTTGPASQLNAQGQFVPAQRPGLVNGTPAVSNADSSAPTGTDMVLNPNGPMSAKTREVLMRQAMMNNGQRKATYPPTPGEIQRLKTQQYLQQQQRQQQQQAQQQQAMQAQQQQAQQQQQQQAQQAQPQQSSQSQQQQAAQQQQMSREDSERLENMSQNHASPIISAPSPSKRQRLSPDGTYAQVPGGLRPQGHMAPAGGPQAQQAQQMLIKAGINPAGLSPQQLQAFQSQTPVMQQQQLSAYVQGLANQQQRAMQQAAKVPGNTAPGQMMSASPVMTNSETGGSGPPEGNHALQDYQMQLMLLEQQNKKRLLMARQEQERLQQPGGENAQGAPFGTNSPQNRGPSSPPVRDAQRGTPKMGNQHGPGSPSEVGAPHPMQNQMQAQIPRNASPAINFNPNHGPPVGDPQQQQMMYRQAMMQQQQQEGGAGGGGMSMMMGPQGPVIRPQMQFPPGHPAYNNPQLMQQMMQSQDPRARMFQQQMMQQQMQQNGHMQRLTPQQQHQHAMAQHAHAQQQAQQAAHHHAQQQQHAQQQIQQVSQPHQQMPPPSAPAQQALNRANAQQGQPPSPSLSNNQPPTPQQAHAKAPARKGAAKESKKGSAKGKKNGQAATPSASEPPTPTTPATPLQNQAQFNHQASHPGQVPTHEQGGFGVIEGGETSAGFSIGDFGGAGDMDLTMMQDFDFDSFLQDEPGNGAMNFAGFGADDP